MQNEENTHLAEQLYNAYGIARNWQKSNGMQMDKLLMHTPKECKIAWQAVADAAEKLVI